MYVYIYIYIYIHTYIHTCIATRAPAHGLYLQGVTAAGAACRSSQPNSRRPPAIPLTLYRFPYSVFVKKTSFVFNLLQ